MFGKNKSQKLSDLQDDASSALQRAAELQRQLEHQKLLLQSMWTILKDKLPATEDDLKNVYDDLKKRGDAKSKDAEPCPNCSRPIQASSPICIYCGVEHNRRNLF